ncbi:hypothetical protein FB451DRAFT_1235112 [Mycena latifolia]|nr:hypothetical protein FB451DRAFT_1235112 [Mycena latifolia]
MRLLQLALSLGWLVITSLGQSQTVCNPTSGLCFEQFFSPVLNVTVGFALPPEDELEFTNEVLVLGMLWPSFPLPYGFAGVVLGDTDALDENSTNLSTLLWYSGFATPDAASVATFSISDCVAELATRGSAHKLTPIMNTPVATTFSPMTTWGNGGAQFIFRCQNCNIVADYFAQAAEVTLTTLISTTYPEYIDYTMTKANVSLVGAQHQEFTLNTNAAHFSNYSSILAVAGFV